MLLIALRLVVTILCLLILASSFCRATLMEGMQRRDIGYSSAALGAAAVAICWSVWFVHETWEFDLKEIVLLAAVAWNQLATINLWRHGTPPELRRIS